MKNVLVVTSFLCLLVSCSKTSSPVQDDQQTENPEICSFGNRSFNLQKRDPLVETIRDKKPQPPGGGGTPPSPTASVLLLDFDGQLVSGTSWNAAGDINCLPANLSSTAINNIISRITNDYSPFNVVVTTEESVYNAAPINKRMRVIFTETWEWFGQAGGTSFLNSFTWGNNTPCFVFTSLLNYNDKQIGEAASHEAGHTFGLRHQATYNGNTLLSEYNYGVGTGETSWAPIMGCGYYKNVTTWHNGPNSTGANAIQNDMNIIAAITGWKTDDYSNTISGAQTLTTSREGLINTATDADFFVINTSTPKTLSLTPFNIGGLNEAANLDMIVKIYNSQGQLITTVEDPLTLNAVTPVNAGQYYVSVSVTANANTSTYGMLAKYAISIN
jgi:hypothetical protein